MLIQKRYRTLIFVLPGSVFLIILFVFIWQKLANPIQPNVTVIKKSEVNYDTQGHLKYYYEPKATQQRKADYNWLSAPIINTINSDSLNASRDYPVNKTPLTYRIITMGDSYTYGQNVNTADNYSSVLENNLNQKLSCPTINHFDVINLGVDGYDLEYSVERLQKRGLKYNPDMVIWFIHSWNFDRINELMPPLEEEARKKGVKDFNEKTGLYEVAGYAFGELQRQYGEEFIQNYQKQVLNKLNSFYKGKLLIVSFPVLPDKYSGLIKDDVSSERNITYYNGITDKRYDTNYYLFDGHPSPAGHKKIAEDIFDYLKNSQLKECN